MGTTRIVVIGAGVFGVTAALAFRRRGYSVTLLDAGTVPHPLAESTDRSKIVRLDYGADELYLDLMEEALPRWRAWNQGMAPRLFHETGVIFLTRAQMRPGGFEHESHRLLVARGKAVERLDAKEIRRRFPAWRTGLFVDGYRNPEGGWVESGKVTARLVREAAAGGVEVLEDCHAACIDMRGESVTGLTREDGRRIEADGVIVTTGAWVADLVPDLADSFRTVGQPVFHLSPSDPSLFASERFPVFGADVSMTGYYGFPIGEDGIVKIANHGPGRIAPPSDPTRAVTEDEERSLRSFLAGALPDLASAPIAATRLCIYCDTWDEHFWIAPHPERRGLVVATGGSGHAFKFAPILGDLVADAFEGVPNPALARFRHRPEARPARGEEAARHHRDDASHLLDGPPTVPPRVGAHSDPGTPSWSFPAGTVLGDRFRVGRHIGQGGMGEVYEAEDLALHRKVALKTIRPSLSSDARAIERFRREVLHATRVTHENVCRVFDIGEHREEGGPTTMFLTMELLNGETLGRRIARAGPLGPEEALGIARQLCGALDAAHRQGVIHRDFKSDNVFLVADGDVGIVSGCREARLRCSRHRSPGTQKPRASSRRASRSSGSPGSSRRTSS